jgi:hypothetical protein
MHNIPTFQSSEINIQTPRSIFNVLDEEYDNYMNYVEKLFKEAPLYAQNQKEMHKNEYDSIYNKLCTDFLQLLPKGENIRIVLKHKSSCPVNRSNIAHVSLTKYEELAVINFVNELKSKNYKVTHGEEVDYRINTDKDDYFDYCDTYYTVCVQIK